MKERHNKDLVLTSLDLVHGLSDDNSNLPAMHQIRLLTNDLIDLINSGVVEITNPLEELVMADPAEFAPAPMQAPPMQPAPAPWGQPASALPSSPPFPPGASLAGVNKLRQTIYDLTFKDIGNYAAEKLYIACQEPAPVHEDTLLLNALEDEMASPDTRNISFVKGQSPGIDIRNSEGGRKTFFPGPSRHALRALKEAHAPD